MIKISSAKIVKDSNVNH